MDGYVDIHSHILPGVDDGCKDWAESLALARFLAANGVDEVVATPHFLPGTSWSASKEKVLGLVAELTEKLIAEAVPLRVHPGMEIGFHHNLEKNIRAGKLLGIAGSNYYLIEPSFHGEQGSLLAAIDSLIKDGIGIILAHPERIEAVQHKPLILRNLVEAGMLVQVNGGSLLGRLGKASQKTAKQLGELSIIHFISSDTHDLTRRPPLSTDCWRQIESMAVAWGLTRYDQVTKFHSLI